MEEQDVAVECTASRLGYGVPEINGVMSWCYVRAHLIYSEHCKRIQEAMQKLFDSSAFPLFQHQERGLGSW